MLQESGIETVGQVVFVTIGSIIGFYYLDLAGLIIGFAAASIVWVGAIFALMFGVRPDAEEL